jgi:hypothetical protein
MTLGKWNMRENYIMKLDFEWIVFFLDVITNFVKKVLRNISYSFSVFFFNLFIKNSRRILATFPSQTRFKASGELIFLIRKKVIIKK